MTKRRFLILLALSGLMYGCSSLLQPHPPLEQSDVAIGIEQEREKARRSVPSSVAVDRVVVYKTQQLLELWHRQDLIRQYSIALGRNPNGMKIREGDFRTPEGRYVLDWRNAESAYYKSIHISYPNEADLRRAKQLGTSPGGLIMIHGQPNWLAGFEPVYHNNHWTFGCIAVSNLAMNEIWQKVPNGTPIEIYP